MKRLLFILLGFLSLPSLAQQSKETGIQWKNKSRLGITVAYDYQKFDHRYTTSNITNYLPIRNEHNQYAQEIIPFLGHYKIKENTLDVLRLQLDYWFFPFLNVYAIGGEIHNHSQISTTLQVKDMFFPSFSSDVSYNGWRYGGGLKGEYNFKNFKPQIGYSIYWDDLDHIHDKSLSQTVNIKLGYSIPINKPWIKIIDLYIGSSYNNMKLKYGYQAFYDEETIQQILKELEIQPPYNIGGVLDVITLKNIHDWNLDTSVDMELCYNLHGLFHASLLGRKTSFSVAISYRLFGKK